MSELQTVSIDDVHARLLDNISDTYQKTEGFPTYDLLRAAAFGIKDAHDKALLVEWMQDVDNLTGDDLEKVIYQRTGLSRKEAVKSTGYITVVHGNGIVQEGYIFETEGGIQFESLEIKSVSDGTTVNVRAVKGGVSGDVAVNTITQMPVTIPGIAEITNPEITTGGYDAESDDDLRDRYYDKLRLPANGVNSNQYKVWAKEVDGCKNAKVIPTWNGINTVKVIIIGNDYRPADAPLVEAVQNYIDPNAEGKGLGVAPIGARTTVVSADVLNINVAVTLSLGTGADSSAIHDEIETVINGYIQSIAFESDYVSLAKIGALILDVEGVLDYSDLTLNGGTSNIQVEFAECPVLNEVIFNE